MSSSTSSSDLASSSPPTEALSGTSSPRPVFARIFLAVTVGMGVALLLLRLLAVMTESTSQNILGRVLEGRAALPKIVAEPEPLVLVFGSSMTDAGFGARQFDRTLREQGATTKSFNFGFGGLNPYFQDILARRIQESFDAKDRRLELALIEFTPFQNTTARWNGAQDVLDSFVSILATPKELWKETLEDPARGVRMLNIRYLRDGLSAEMITSHFAQELQPRRRISQLEEDEAIVKRRGEINEALGEKFDEEYPDWDGAEWSWVWQGAGTIPEERSQETLELFVEFYETLRTPYLLEDDKFNRIHCCDIEELHFEEELVAAFIRTVQTFKEFSNHVEVILLPRNTDWIQYSPEAQQRLQAVLNRIREETGVAVRDFQQIEGIGPDMFSDTTHLSRYGGDVAFTDFLTREYGPRLGAAPQDLQPVEPSPNPTRANPTNSSEPAQDSLHLK